MTRWATITFLLISIAGMFAETPDFALVQPAIEAMEIPMNRGATAVWQSLKKLHTRASLIMITAHPDDEDGGMLTYESRGAGTRVALLTLNRGEGGANVMSADYWDALGLTRTQELLAAGRYYGVDQFWTRVCDYGFSKTLDEALQKWSRDRVLSDAVRVVRMTRPLVVTSVFLGAPSDGHGNHQLAGLMAKEVYEAAADSSRFPDQIRAGLRPWKPLKYYAHTPWFGNDRQTLSVNVQEPVGNYDPLLGESYMQASRAGLGFEKSQNGGQAIPRAGKVLSDYHRFASRVAAPDKEQSFFDGIDVSLAGIADLAGDGDRTFLVEGLREMNDSVEDATARFSTAHPEESAPALANGMKQTEALIERVRASNLTEDAKYDVLHELNVKLAQFNQALVEALGISMRATVMPERTPSPEAVLFMGDPDTFRMAIPGQRFGVQVSVVNQSPEQVDLARVSLQSAAPDGWRITPKQLTTGPLESLSAHDSQFEVEAANSLSFTRPYFVRPSIEQPYYDILDGRYLNLSAAPYPLNASVELRYRDVTVRDAQVIQTSQRVVGSGVVYQPLTAGPAISLTVSPRAGIVPLDAKSFKLNVGVHSNMKGPAKGSVVLRLPAEWRSEPPIAVFTTDKDGEDREVRFSIFPNALREQDYEITAVANYAGKEYREGYQVTGYPGLRPYFLYQPSTYRTRGVKAKIAPGLNVAYIAGSGDDVPASLENLGVHVTLLGASDLAGGDLHGYDAILVGIRAYAVRPDLVTHNERLLDYVKNGGVMIVQYNTPEFDHNFGPYPYKMGEEPEEVTDEASKVNILDRQNPLLLWPNQISEADFRGWIEERGSKFMTSWDSRYEPLLETHDPGQKPQTGGLLYAKYGNGVYVYNAYAFYRELPEGVPGAYRLMANMLSLAKNPHR